MVWALSQDDYNLSLAMALGTENNLKTFWDCWGWAGQC
jgi:hypothetical protein